MPARGDGRATIYAPRDAIDWKTTTAGIPSKQQKILVSARDASDRYSAIQIMSSDEFKFLVDTFAKSESAHNVMLKLRALPYSEDSPGVPAGSYKNRDLPARRMIGVAMQRFSRQV